jgi:hypothetical protein
MILKVKKPMTGNTNPKSQIDQLVYLLYDLTEEEIRIVEGGEI